MKKKIIAALTVLPLLAFFSSLLSFSTGEGGEGFEVFLNEKVLVQKFGKDLDKIANIDLSKASPEDELRVRYYHCNNSGTDRQITIKDVQGRIVKVWNFTNVNSNQTIMSCKLKEIPRYKQITSTSSLKLFYSSSELPNGRQLASLNRR